MVGMASLPHVLGHIPEHLLYVLTAGERCGSRDPTRYPCHCQHDELRMDLTRAEHPADRLSGTFCQRRSHR